MALSVTSRIEDGFAILEIAGTMRIGPSLNAIRKAAGEALDSNKVSGLILRVAEVTAIDTEGLSELTRVYTHASRRSCPLRLVEAGPRLRQVLEITHLDGLFPSAPDIATAKKELRAA